jgi:hypothetical protein
MSLVCAQCHCCEIEWKQCVDCEGFGCRVSGVGSSPDTQNLKSSTCNSCHGAGGRWTCSGGCSPEAGPHKTEAA